MFERYIEGVGLKYHSKRINSKRNKTPKGGTKWCESTIRGILKMKKYIEMWVNGKNIYNRSNIT